MNETKGDGGYWFDVRATLDVSAKSLTLSKSIRPDDSVLRFNDDSGTSVSYA